MALPTINTPTYELEIPSTDEKIKYRPFLVKEEKILMIAMEGANQNDIINAVKEIVLACTFNKLDISNMPMFDLEYVFLQIRAKSVGEVSQVKLRCPDDNETFAEVEIDLTKVKVQVDDNHTNKIELTDDMGIVMKYPTVDTFGKSGVTEVTAENMIDVISSCIHQIYEKKGEVVYDAKDSTRKELNDFVEQCNAQQFKEIQSFFDTMPRLKHTVKVKNPKTKVESDIELNGLNDFFG